MDLLVNNAGVGIAGGFADADPAALDALTALNVVAVQRLTHAAVRSMLPRGRGAILNVSSVSGFAPGPRSASYSSSKAWVTAFSQALHLQLAGSGIRVMALCPGFIRSDFHARAGLDMSRLPGWLWLDADRVAAEGLRDLAAGQGGQRSRAPVQGDRRGHPVPAARSVVPRRRALRSAGRLRGLTARPSVSHTTTGPLPVTPATPTKESSMHRTTRVAVTWLAGVAGVALVTSCAAVVTRRWRWADPCDALDNRASGGPPPCRTGRGAGRPGRSAA